ncbi:phenylalanine--tRNA ligase subunit alpha [Candidatus Saccharibacteria bacterium]|nr:phenylalanine--tRNA ligase subunit alpha [Candidatus Saccharibacteria bacterium]
MSYKNQRVADVADLLKERLSSLDDKKQILRAVELKALFAELPNMPADERASFGKDINKLKQELENYINVSADSRVLVDQIDVTAPFDINSPVQMRPRLLSAEHGSSHPLMSELKKVVDIFGRMGFVHMDSRQIDDEYHMFDSLNFPSGHPARDDYDTFLTTDGFVAPAHVSVMQNRLQKKYAVNLNEGKPIAVVYTGRTFRNEDVDARHEHTFYQVEISYIDKDINTSNLVATFKTFLEEYYQQDLDIRIQPFYFPFTEPSFEMALSCPFCKKKGCHVCSQSGWIELLGCGMINPNVMKMGGIDTDNFTGFAGGLGLDRLVMMKYGIEDVRHFESGKLDFLRQFS